MKDHGTISVCERSMRSSQLTVRIPGAGVMITVLLSPITGTTELIHNDLQCQSCHTPWIHQDAWKCMAAQALARCEWKCGGNSGRKSCHGLECTGLTEIDAEPMSDDQVPHEYLQVRAPALKYFELTKLTCLRVRRNRRCVALRHPGMASEHATAGAVKV